MPATPEQAIAAARHQSQHGPPFGYGLCLQRCRLCYEVPARYPDASTAWHRATHKHPTTNAATIPRGAPVFWTGGNKGHGHIAISTGNGWCWSTDIRRTGYFDHVPIDTIRREWGLTLVGWTEDINGVRVWTPEEDDEVTPDDIDKIAQRTAQLVLDGLAKDTTRLRNLIRMVRSLGKQAGLNPDKPKARK